MLKRIASDDRLVVYHMIHDAGYKKKIAKECSEGNRLFSILNVEYLDPKLLEKMDCVMLEKYGTTWAIVVDTKDGEDAWRGLVIGN